MVMDMQRTSSMEVARIYESVLREGKHMTKDNRQLLLTQTRNFAKDIAGVYSQVMEIDKYLSRGLYSRSGGKSVSEYSLASSNMQQWGKDGHSYKTRELTLESVLNTYHPVLENLSRYLSTRDLIKLANASKTLQKLLYSHSLTWRYLDFRSSSIGNSKLELLKNRRRIGFSLQNQPVYPEVGFTSELAMEILFKIPITHLRYLVFDGTDIGDAALRLYLSKGRSTLAYVSVRNCGHINPGALLEYFSREVEAYLPRPLKTLKLCGIPGILRGSTSELIESVSELGEAISGLFDVLDSLNIKTDVGFCAAGVEYCQTVLENYPHAMDEDGVIGLKKKRRCGTCEKARIEAFCKVCEAERMCTTCEDLGTPTFLCRECQPDSLDGVLWPHYCECGRALCALCFDQFAITYRDCPGFQCRECDRDKYFWPVERITVKRYRCDHCGLDRCPKCWVNTDLKLKICVQCDRSLCETCGIKLACKDCNACICEDCYNPTEYPKLSNVDWYCEYCQGIEGIHQSNTTTLSTITTSTYQDCTHNAKQAECDPDANSVCNLLPAGFDRHMDRNPERDKENQPENPWVAAAAKRKRTGTDVLEETHSKRVRLGPTETTLNEDSPKSCAII